MRADTRDTYHAQHFGLIWTESATTRQRLSQRCERARLLLCVYVLRVSSRELAGAESTDPGPGMRKLRDLESNDEKTEEFRNILCVNADLEVEDKKCIFR